MRQTFMYLLTHIHIYIYAFAVRLDISLRKTRLE